MKKIIILGLLLFPLLSSYSQSKKEVRQQKKLEEFNITKALVESGTFEFVASTASPLRGGNVDLYSNPNFLRFTDSIADADMPFFGQGYNVAYGGPGGIKFKEKMENYKVKINEKKFSIVVSFKVRDNSDLFECELKIFSRHNASLYVMSWKRDAITYNGIINPIVKKE